MKTSMKTNAIIVLVVASVIVIALLILWLTGVFNITAEASPSETGAVDEDVTIQREKEWSKMVGESFQNI